MILSRCEGKWVSRKESGHIWVRMPILTKRKQKSIIILTQPPSEKSSEIHSRAAGYPEYSNQQLADQAAPGSVDKLDIYRKMFFFNHTILHHTVQQAQGQ